MGPKMAKLIRTITSTSYIVSIPSKNNKEEYIVVLCYKTTKNNVAKEEINRLIFSSVSLEDAEIEDPEERDRILKKAMKVVKSIK